MGKVIQIQQCTIKPEVLIGVDGNMMRKCVEDNMMSQLKRAIEELRWEDIVTVKEEETSYTYSIRLEFKTGKDDYACPTSYYL